MMEGLVGVYDLDHNTTPEVVRISKVSNILRRWNCVNTQSLLVHKRIADSCVLLIKRQAPKAARRLSESGA